MKFLRLTVFVVVGAAFAWVVMLSGMSIPHAMAQSDQIVTFAPSWRYAGNETLSGALGDVICSIPPTPCPNHPEFTAKKYVNGDGMPAYLVTRLVGEIDATGHETSDEFDIVFLNSDVYCVSTNSTPADPSVNRYFECPEVISDLSLLYTANQTFNVPINDHESRIIRYGLSNGAELKSVIADIPTKTLKLVVDSAQSGGRLTLHLPRDLIDSRTPRHLTPDCWSTNENNTRIYTYCDEDIDFNVNINHLSNGSSFEKVGSTIENGTRLLVIDFQKGTSVIVLQGTTIVPEFGPSIILTISVSMIASVLAIQRFRKLDLG